MRGDHHAVTGAAQSDADHGKLRGSAVGDGTSVRGNSLQGRRAVGKNRQVINSERLRNHGGTENAETHGERFVFCFSSVRLRDLRDLRDLRVSVVNELVKGGPQANGMTS
jgi:hypothetical protein